MMKQEIEEYEDLDYCKNCGQVMRFNKCSNGCYDEVKR